MKKMIAAVAVMALAGSAMAQITTVDNQNALGLANSVLAGGGLTVVGASLQSFGGPGFASSGYFLAGPNAYNLGPGGIVLSSGAVNSYGTGPNTSSAFTTAWGVLETPGDKVLLDPVTGVYDHYDVTRLDIQFTSPTDQLIAFDCVFGSEEWSEYVGSQFVDGFGLYLNGGNIAFAGGLPVNINHPWMQNLPETELDGVLVDPTGNAKIKYTGMAHAGINTLTFIVADTSDTVLDTTVYIEGLIPAPSAAALLGLGGLVVGRRRR